MNKEDDIHALQTDLLDLLANHLTPAAIRYGYSDTPLESNIKWRPLILIIGNYSSGKSTLINDFIGAEIQATGQAPTDDSFTVLTYDDSIPADKDIRVTEQRDGNYLLSDPEFPFESLKKHGQQFASHFCLKKINASFLKSFAIIDTPGMLDSITKRDRGYDYLQVVGDIAHMADLVLVLFDPHKAGTVREAHISLRDTLPVYTFENRVLYVLNRIDECSSLVDLLRVYGTLCWNLSQITGRKDIPPIRLTYSQRAAEQAKTLQTGASEYLHHLNNQREELKTALMQAPQYHLDNLATFLETHSNRLAHLLEALLSYRQKRRGAFFRFLMTGLMISLPAAGAAALLLTTSGLPATPDMLYLAGGITGVAFFTLWISFIRKYYMSRFHRQQMKNADELTSLENQKRKETWQFVKVTVLDYLKKTGGVFSLWTVKQEYAAINDIAGHETKGIREALNEINAAKRDRSPGSALSYRQSSYQQSGDDV
ncbi:MAG: dynamin family protein [Thermodesulfobacteriota bacterium]